MRRLRIKPVQPGPFIKWVGGKRRLLRQLVALLPGDFGARRYVEPFLGGGALFFDRRPRSAVLADTNKDLIATYVVVRSLPQRLIGALAMHARLHSPEHFAAVRDHFNERQGGPVERAAAFIYLNHTCFNGVYRVNLKGEFNVPIGRYAHPAILDASGLAAASACLRGTLLLAAPFDQVVEQQKIGPRDFVYLDPPYVPTSPTANFTTFTPGGFGLEAQQKLRDVAVELDRRGARWMLSNSDVPIVRELYKGFDLQEVTAPRAVNSNTEKRGSVVELVVRNYT